MNLARRSEHQLVDLLTSEGLVDVLKNCLKHGSKNDYIDMINVLKINIDPASIKRFSSRQPNKYDTPELEFDHEFKYHVKQSLNFLKEEKYREIINTLSLNLQWKENLDSEVLSHVLCGGHHVKDPQKEFLQEYQLLNELFQGEFTYYSNSYIVTTSKEVLNKVILQFPFFFRSEFKKINLQPKGDRHPNPLVIEIFQWKYEQMLKFLQKWNQYFIPTPYPILYSDLLEFDQILWELTYSHIKKIRSTHIEVLRHAIKPFQDYLEMKELSAYRVVSDFDYLDEWEDFVMIPVNVLGSFIPWVSKPFPENAKGELRKFKIYDHFRKVHHIYKYNISLMNDSKSQQLTLCFSNKKLANDVKKSIRKYVPSSFRVKVFPKDDYDKESIEYRVIVFPEHIESLYNQLSKVDL